MQNKDLLKWERKEMRSCRTKHFDRKTGEITCLQNCSYVEACKGNETTQLLRKIKAKEQVSKAKARREARKLKKG